MDLDIRPNMRHAAWRDVVFTTPIRAPYWRVVVGGTRGSERSALRRDLQDVFADLVVADLVTACKRTPAVETASGDRYDLSRACTILERWDRRADADSVGYALFREFTARMARGDDAIARPELWRTPFNPADPFHTPRELNTDNPEILQDLASAAEYLDRQGIPLGAPWGQLQFVVRRGRKLPIHGGFQLWDNIVFPLKAHVGYTDLPNYMNGNCYEQAVTFSARGPVAEGISAGSQAPDDVDSPYYADQTEMYSRKEWMRLPFTAEEIAHQLVSPTIVLRVPAPKANANP